MEHWDTTRGLKHYLNNCITLELSEKNQIVTQKSGSPAGFFNRTRSSDPAGQSGKNPAKPESGSSLLKMWTWWMFDL